MRSIKKPNVKGPRFREKRISLLTVNTLKAFKKKFPQYSNVSLEQFRNIIRTFNDNLIQGMIDNRNGIELPEGLGNIFMGTCDKAKGRNIDYKKSIEYGVEVIHKNWESDNRLLKIFYTNYNTKYSFANKQVWRFKASKPVRKKASLAYKKDWDKYIKIPSSLKISIMFNKQRNKERMNNLKPIIPENYNEFKL